MMETLNNIGLFYFTILAPATIDHGRLITLNLSDKPSFGSAVI